MLRQAAFFGDRTHYNTIWHCCILYRYSSRAARKLWCGSESRVINWSVGDTALMPSPARIGIAMNSQWITAILDSLSTSTPIGYTATGSAAAEPTALAVLALAAHERVDVARELAGVLTSMQQSTGAVGIRSGEPGPGWPTSLAVTAWTAADRDKFDEQIARGVGWLLANRGALMERSRDFGHDSTLVGWAYAEGTHSWVEPTAFAVLALRAVGNADHPAVLEGIAVLRDRQLPNGGLNYGNTIVLGQSLRAHVQPTGIALLALAGIQAPDYRQERSLAWLHKNVGPHTTPLSLGWAVLGMRAQSGNPQTADEWLAAAAARIQQHDHSSHKLALLALAAKGWPL